MNGARVLGSLPSDPPGIGQAGSPRARSLSLSPAHLFPLTENEGFPLPSLTIPKPASTALQPSALMLPEGLSFDEWEDVGRFLRTCEGAVQWWTGDWLNYGERAYGEKYAQAVEATGYRPGYLMNIASVASRFEISRRREILSFGHHATVAYLEPAEADRLLDEAIEREWTRVDLRRAVRLYRAALSDPNAELEEEPEPHPMDIVAEYERVENENMRLHQTIDSLQKDDVTTELAKLHEKYARLEGRLQQEMTTRSEAEKDAKYAKGMLRKIRQALGIERDKDILPALQDLLR